MSSEKGFGFAELKCQTFRGLIFWELDSFWADDNGDDWGDYLTQWVDEEEEEEPRAMEEEEEEEVEELEEASFAVVEEGVEEVAVVDEREVVEVGAMEIAEAVEGVEQHLHLAGIEQRRQIYKIKPQK